MKSTEQGLWGTVVAGAVQGLMAWTAYAVVECCFLSILPRLGQPSFSAPLPEWQETALFFSIYGALGLLLGGLSGLAIGVAARRIPILVKGKVTRLISAAAASTLIWALAINLAVWSYPSPSIWVRFLVSVLLTAGLAWSAGSGSLAEQLGFFLNPWSLSLLLLGLPWMSRKLLLHSPTAVKAGTVLAYLLAVSLTGRLIQKALAAPEGNAVEARQVVLWKPLARLAGLVAIVLGTAFFLEYRHPLMAAIGKAAPPNVVLVVMDTVRADHLSVYGYERDTSPNLKKFAEEATLYSQAISSSNITLSSHASLFTGLYARRHGARLSGPSENTDNEAGYPLADKFHTLAEILSENGYHTMGVAANDSYLGPGFRLDQGFVYYSVFGMPPAFVQLPRFFLAAGLRKLQPTSSVSAGQLHQKAESVNRQAFPLLDRARKYGRPFFLFLNYMDAHQPLVPPPPFDTLFPGKDATITPERCDVLQWHVNKLREQVTERERQHLLSQYDGGIAYLDFHLGKLLQQLRDLGLYENSLLLITSDHGQALGERSLVGHAGVSVYQDVVHVPLLIRYPHTSQKAVVEEPVSLVDILPTVLDVLGLEIPRGIDGQSLRQLASGGPRFVISECFPDSSFSTCTPGLTAWKGR
ncbi:MAG: sulfatase, partial [Acidobacteria bacterium]|nr:sulfatase [Acidobacteriota bacterium]